ncbi:hypothetical protein BDU57DRAFT_572165 [Ampelomyces quisqualis]|uniref:Uncharacterized protein n=1 Tax=Ampelomyces quisqualis TaxID=50730 RepID=A0A6A5QTN8_AMPQU|nr:hypothetical protein BDU57DRAFT_572165 [Ampelomyces quisqualis]
MAGAEARAARDDVAASAGSGSDGRATCPLPARLHPRPRGVRRRRRRGRCADRGRAHSERGLERHCAAAPSAQRRGSLCVVQRARKNAKHGLPWCAQVARPQAAGQRLRSATVGSLTLKTQARGLAAACLPRGALLRLAAMPRVKLLHAACEKLRTLAHCATRHFPRPLRAWSRASELLPTPPRLRLIGEIPNFHSPQFIILVIPPTTPHRPCTPRQHCWTLPLSPTALSPDRPQAPACDGC